MIDAHHHFWSVGAQEQPWRTKDHEAIARDFTPEDLGPHLLDCGIEGTVLVQSVDLAAENDRMATFERSAKVRGVVGWLPLREPDVARSELDRSQTPLWSGVRCLIGHEDADWLADERVRKLFRDLASTGLAWDVVPVTPGQVESVVELAQAVPDLRIVVNHMARPPIGKPDDGWRDRIRVLAARPNIAIKVSVGIDVLTTWPQWDRDALTEPVTHVLAHFGPGRSMLASNWPVVTLRANYATAWADLDGVAVEVGLSASELAAVRGGTAVGWYGLDRT